DALADQLRNRLVVEERASEIAMQRPVRPVEILHIEGTVEAVEMRHLRDLLGLRRIAGQRRGKVAGEPQQAEADDRNGERHQHRDCRAMDEKTNHDASPAPRRALLRGARLSIIVSIPAPLEFLTATRSEPRMLLLLRAINLAPDARVSNRGMRPRNPTMPMREPSGKRACEWAMLRDSKFPRVPKRACDRRRSVRDLRNCLTKRGHKK